MPRYYMRLEPSGFEDVEGEELPGPEAAKRLAKEVALDLINHPQSEPWQHLIVVRDETGTIIHEQPLILH